MASGAAFGATRLAGDRQRADVLLVARGLFPSRAQARAAIEAGLVTADGQRVAKPSLMLADTVALEAQAAHPWASRAGVKLDHGLSVFDVDPADAVCLDVGASTGGFVDVLLSRGAARVYAVDVGRDQLRAHLAADPRVDDLSGQDARTLTRAQIPEAPGLITCDASFIGLMKVLPAALALAAEGAALMALFKPQFEVGPKAVGKGGIVTDSQAIAAALDGVKAALAALGWPVVGETPSPITGGDGNREYLLYARRA